MSIPVNVEELEDGWCCNTKYLTDVELYSENKNFKYLDPDHKIIIGKSNNSEKVYDILSFASRDIYHAIIPPFIKHISSEAFSNCQKLESIEIPTNSELETIGKDSFCNTNINQIFIPKHVHTIGSCAFIDCEELKTVEFAENSELKTIGKKAFSCTKIESFLIPPSVKKIDSFTFYCCSKLNAIQFSECSELETIEKYAFSYSNIQFLTIPKSAKEIGNFAFYKCEQLITVNFEPFSEMKLIGNGAFSFLLIEKITIPKSVEKIDDYAFFKCRYLQEVLFEEGSNLTSIGEYAFSGVSIERFTILPHLVELNENWCCHTPHLADIEISPENEKFSFLDFERKIIVCKSNDCEGDDNCEDIVIASRDIVEVFIPPFVQRICSGAFACESLKKVTFSEDSKTESIGESAFYNSSIECLAVPQKVAYIGDEAFSLCTELVAAEFLCDDCISFGKFCFNSCESLIVVSFPNAKKVLLLKQEFCDALMSFQFFTCVYAEVVQIVQFA